MPSKTFSVDFETSGFRKASRQMESVGDEAESSGSKLKTAGKAGAAAIAGITTAVTGAVAGMAKLTQNTAQYASQVDNAAEQSGLAAERIQEIAFAAEQTSGAEFDTVRDGLKELAIRSEEAANGTGEAKEAFDELGISQEELQSMSTAETFRRVRQELQGASTGMRTFAAETIFGGEAGEKLVETLGLSNAEMQEMSKRARQTGKVLSGEQVAALDQTRKAWDRIWSTLQGVGRTIVTALLPVTRRLTPIVQRAATRLQQMMSGIDASAVGSAMDTAIGWTQRLWAVTKQISQGVMQVWNSLTSGISKVWDEWGGFIMQRTRTIFQGLKTAFFALGGVVQGVWDTLIGVLTGNWGRAWDGIKTAVKSAAIAIVDQVAQLVQSVLNKLSKLSEWVPGFGDNMKSTFDFASGAVANFRDRLEESAQAASGMQSAFGGFSGGDFGGGGAGGLFSMPSADAERPGSASVNTGGGSGGGGGGEQKGILQVIDELTPKIQRANNEMTIMEATSKRAEQTLKNGFSSVASGIGKATVGLLEGENAVKNFTQSAVRGFKNMLKQLAAVVSKLLVVKGLKAALGVSTGGITSIGGVVTEAIGLAEGGIVTGPTLAMVGEGGESEAVIPLSKLNGMMGGTAVQVQVQGETRREGRDLVTTYDSTKRAQSRRGR